jgi:transcriptional regulator
MVLPIEFFSVVSRIERAEELIKIISRLSSRITIPVLSSERKDIFTLKLYPESLSPDIKLRT